MSADEQARTATLTEFVTDTTEDTSSDDGAQWEPDDSRTCRNCGERVPDAYRRVLGDNNDVVHECPRCPSTETSQTRRTSGAAAGLDIQERGLGGVVQ
jgi:hypothetical protein